MCDFRINFDCEKVLELAQRYIVENEGNEDETVRDSTVQKLVDDVKRNRFLTRNQFLDVCAWKTKRSKSRCKENGEELIKEVSLIAFSTPNEELRIGIWTLLHGVGMPTASVFLHWFHPTDKYPILDVRALESLSLKEPRTYNYGFWDRYTRECRRLATEYKVDMRTLDRALWQWSAERSSR